MNIVLSTKPNVIRKKDMNLIEFILIFPVETNFEDRINQRIMEYIMNKSKYDIREMKEFKKEKLKKMLLRTNLSKNEIVDNSFITYSFTLPKEGILNDYNLEDAFKLAVDILKHPAVENGEFDHKLFNYEYEYFKDVHKNSLQGIYRKNRNIIRDIIDPNEEINISHDHAGRILDSTTPKSVYDYYEKNIVNNNFISYVCGDIEEDRVLELFNKYLKQDCEEISIDINYFKCMKSNGYKYHEETNEYNQSELCMEYQVGNLLEKERVLLSCIYNFLNATENNLIFEKLRVENNLVYETNVDSKSDRGILLISSYIPKDKKDEVIKLVGEVIDSLRDEEFTNNCLERLKKALKIDLLRSEDDPLHDINEKIVRDLQQSNLQKLYDEVKNVTGKDIVEFLDRLELTNVIFLRGEGND